MATNLEVTCINKTDRLNPHERISYIGGRYPNGTRWRLSVAEAILRIAGGNLNLYVNVGGHPVAVIVATSAAGHKYLRTLADDEHSNNLLSLPECPA